MLTIFTTAKPFDGCNAVIQRNALKSWTLLSPDVEIILFRDGESSTETCEQLGIRHEARVERSESRLKRIDAMFDRAAEVARHDILCYVNCGFLMAGRCWDTDIV